MNNKNYNYRLAEDMVKTVEEGLKDIFQKRSNQIYYKLDNILKMKKYQLIILINLQELGMMICQGKKLMIYLLSFFVQKNQLSECNLLVEPTL